MHQSSAVNASVYEIQEIQQVREMLGGGDMRLCGPNNTLQVNTGPYTEWDHLLKLIAVQANTKQGMFWLFLRRDLDIPQNSLGLFLSLF